MSFCWKFELDTKGFKELHWRDWPYSEMLDKGKYVEDYLSPSIEHSGCGWNHCEYFVMENRDGYSEFVCLFPTADGNGGRYYDVTGLNEGGIAKEIWDGVFK